MTWADGIKYSSYLNSTDAGAWVAFCFSSDITKYNSCKVECPEII